MKKDGFSVDQVFNQNAFRADEREMVLKAVHVVQPNYQPSQKQPPSVCSSPLVHDFYTQVSALRRDLRSNVVAIQVACVVEDAA